MDIDALAKDFYRFKPMLEDMLINYKEYTARQAQAYQGPAEAVDAELHAAIHAPLHESEEQIAARADQIKANDEEEAAALAEAAQAETDAANAALQAEADQRAEAERLQAEADAKAIDTGKPDGDGGAGLTLDHVALVPAGQQPDPNATVTQLGADTHLQTGARDQLAAATGQNQGQGSTGAAEGGNPPENAAKALPEPSPVDQAQAETVATDQGTTAKPVE